jgi:hypothetical protein
MLDDFDADFLAFRSLDVLDERTDFPLDENFAAIGVG